MTQQWLGYDTVLYMGTFILVEPATLIFYTAYFMHYDEVKNSRTINKSISTIF